MGLFLSQYRNEWQKSLSMPWRSPSIIGLLRDFKRWELSQAAGKSPLMDHIPWITFSAIHFLDKILRKEMTVFEYGSGGSTIYFAQRVRKVFSIEHDDEWAIAVEREIAKEGLQNVEVQCILPCPNTNLLNPDPADPAQCFSASEAYLDHDFSDYVGSIENFPDSSLDIVFIDGRSRPACFRSALGKVRLGGYVCMDNTERWRYARAMQLAFEGFKFYDFPGPSPYVTFFTRTSIWQRIQ